MIIVDLCVPKPKLEKRHVTSRNMKQLNTNNFMNDVLKCLSTKPNLSAGELDYALQTTLDEHAPLVTRHISSRPVSPWYCLDIKDAKKLKRQAERKWRKSGLEIHRTIFTKQRNEANGLVDKLKRHYFLNKFEGIKSCKELFVTTDFLLGKENNTALPSGSDKDLCERFLNFFNKKIVTIRTALDSQQCPSVEFCCFDGQIFDTFKEVSDIQIMNLLKSSSPKTCDLDPIPTRVILDCMDTIVPFIIQKL